MQASPATAGWARYQVTGEASFLRGFEETAYAIDSALAGHAWLVPLGTTVTPVAGILFDGARYAVDVKAEPARTVDQVRDAVRAVSDAAVPGTVASWVAIALSLGDEVVGQTARDTGAVVSTAAGGISKVLPWLAVLTVAVVALLLLRRSK